MRISAAEQRIEDLEAQLKASQDKLKTVELKLKTSEERLVESQAELKMDRKERRSTFARLQTTRFYRFQLDGMVDMLKSTLDARDERISELESEVEALSKENDDLLPMDEDPTEDMDIEPVSEQDDDDLRGEGGEDSGAVMSEDEDPEEPPFDSDAAVDVE